MNQPAVVTAPLSWMNRYVTAAILHKPLWQINAWIEDGTLHTKPVNDALMVDPDDVEALRSVR